ncbi:MAG: hypothetical protein C3F17_18105 [Bradyrhizobiaceae bacterium]|nr:MAG: hypothetical protein C3F17_18105 [Bradyrhizobiaceae bacterium]
MGSVAQIAVTLTPDGEIHHLGDFHVLAFGELSGQRSPRCDDFARLCAGANFTSRLSDNILLESWDKLVFLATLAGMTCLMRASVGIILSTDDGATLMQRLLDECSAVATAEGFAPDAVALARYRAMLMEHGSSLTASMLRDVERGAPTEAAHVLGDLVRRAQSRGIDTPVLRIAHAHLQAYEATRNAAAGH